MIWRLYAGNKILRGDRNVIIRRLAMIPVSVVTWRGVFAADAGFFLESFSDTAGVKTGADGTLSIEYFVRKEKNQRTLIYILFY